MLRRTPIRIVVVDDHPLMREGIIASLGRAEDIRVVGEARNGEEAVMLVTNLRPDVVLMDLDMPTMDGTTAIRVLTEKFPGVKILVLSAYEDNQHVYTAMQAGAVGYVIKHTNQASLLNVIRSAHNGDILISPYLARLTLKDLDAPSSYPEIHLTKREKEVLNRIIGGRENDAIAEALAMSRDTLKTHLKHIFEKLQVKNRTQAAVKAMEKGILPAKKD
ncbi:MAG: response regulator transcription factor [Nitrospirae bacterium]|nr:response regulator transcription factor [Nitrospirota bacterium]